METVVFGELFRCERFIKRPEINIPFCDFFDSSSGGDVLTIELYAGGLIVTVCPCGI